MNRARLYLSFIPVLSPTDSEEATGTVISGVSHRGVQSYHLARKCLKSSSAVPTATELPKPRSKVSVSGVKSSIISCAHCELPLSHKAHARRRSRDGKRLQALHSIALYRVYLS
jgi:hypothetical protein